MRLYAIAAMCFGNGIGVDGDRLPWSLPNEFAYFLRVVTRTDDPDRRNAVIMGRRTWNSLTPELRPIANCLNVIVSTSLTSKHALEVERAKDLDNCELCVSLDAALELLKQRSDLVESVFAVGGTQIYRAALESPLFRRFYLTRILADFKECNVFIEPPGFLGPLRRLESEELAKESRLYECNYNEVQSENGLEYIFEVYEPQSIN